MSGMTLRRGLAALGVAAACAAATGTDASARSGWNATGSMATRRGAAAAAVLHDGRVLVAGGFSGAGEVAEADLYDPATGTWSATAPLPAGRHYTTATTLQDGRVLVAGGSVVGGPTADVRLWDPATGAWTAAAPMLEPRSGHRAVLLGNGRVLVLGGAGRSFAARATAELYDPVSGTWTLVGNAMSAPREEQQAALLPDGRVLVSGGHNSGVAPATFAATADLYDPATNLFTPTGPMSVARTQAGFTTLPDGDVLVAGGVNRSGFVTGVERYDAASGGWSPAGALPFGGNVTVAAALPGGDVLLSNDGGATTPIWSAAGTISSGFASTQARALPTLTALGDGRVLLAGGTAAGGVRLAAAELFTPPTTRTAAADAGAFGEVAAGAQTERDMTVTNTGAARLWVDDVALAGAGANDFAIVADGCSVRPVLAGASCTVRVRFAPSAVGARAATLAFDDNAESSPAVALSGTGTEAPRRDPDPDPVVPPPGTPTPVVPVPPLPTPPTPAAPRPAAPRRTPSPIARVEIAARCIRPDRAGRVRVGLRVTLTTDAPLRVRVLRAVGTKGMRRCPRGGSFRGRLQPVGGTVTVPPRARAAAGAPARAALVRATRILRLRLKPALYRVEVRVALGNGRLSAPTRRWVRVLTPTR